MVVDNRPVFERSRARRLSPPVAVFLTVLVLIVGQTVFTVVRHLHDENEAQATVTVSEAGGAESPLGSRGIKGHVVSSDGEIVIIESAGRPYTLHHLSREQIETLREHQASPITIDRGSGGRTWIRWGFSS